MMKLTKESLLLNYLIAIVTLFIICSKANLNAQNPEITTSYKNLVIEKASQELTDRYVFPTPLIIVLC